MQYKVITGMMIKRHYRFNGKSAEPINLYDVYMGKEGDDFNNPTPNIMTEYNGIRYFNPLIGSFKTGQFPEIENLYKSNSFAYYVTDENIKEKVLEILK